MNVDDILETFFPEIKLKHLVSELNITEKSAETNYFYKACLHINNDEIDEAKELLLPFLTHPDLDFINRASPKVAGIIGTIYDDGIWVDKDESEAIKYYKIAANRNCNGIKTGDSESQYRLAKKYEKELKKDHPQNITSQLQKKLFYYLRTAASSNHHNALILLGHYYYKNQDYGKALIYFKRAWKWCAVENVDVLNTGKYGSACCYFCLGKIENSVDLFKEISMSIDIDFANKSKFNLIAIHFAMLYEVNENEVEKYMEDFWTDFITLNSEYHTTSDKYLYDNPKYYLDECFNNLDINIDASRAKTTLKYVYGQPIDDFHKDIIYIVDEHFKNPAIKLAVDKKYFKKGSYSGTITNNERTFDCDTTLDIAFKFADNLKTYPNMYRAKQKKVSACDYALSWIIKNTRNWLAHKKMQELDKQDTSFLYLVALKYLFGTKSTAKDKLLLQYLPESKFLLTDKIIQDKLDSTYKNIIDDLDKLVNFFQTSKSSNHPYVVNHQSLSILKKDSYYCPPFLKNKEGVIRTTEITNHNSNESQKYKKNFYFNEIANFLVTHDDTLAEAGITRYSPIKLLYQMLFFLFYDYHYKHYKNSRSFTINKSDDFVEELCRRVFIKAFP